MYESITNRLSQTPHDITYSQGDIKCSNIKIRRELINNKEPIINHEGANYVFIFTHYDINSLDPWAPPIAC